MSFTKYCINGQALIVESAIASVGNLSSRSRRLLPSDAMAPTRWESSLLRGRKITSDFRLIQNSRLLESSAAEVPETWPRKFAQLGRWRSVTRSSLAIRVNSRVWQSLKARPRGNGVRRLAATTLPHSGSSVNQRVSTAWRHAAPSRAAR